MEDDRARLRKAKRIVVKVGTTNLTDENGVLSGSKVRKLVEELVALRQRGKEVILVSSGAIASGMGQMGIQQRPREIKLLQAIAAVGQNTLMHRYVQEFSRRGQNVGQILLTHEDFFSRERYLHARHTLLQLLKMGVIPIINENDSVSVEEILHGDNDNLAALVAGNIEADLLILLSDIEGLYTGDPRRDRKVQLVRLVGEITLEVKKKCGKGSSQGRGGMISKLAAVEKVMEHGIPVIIANGSRERVVSRLLAGEQLGTLFLPHKTLNDRRHWIRYGSKVQGRITIDEGAVKALLERGASLLPSGVVRDSVSGSFAAGEVIELTQQSTATTFARGICNYSSQEMREIAGLSTSMVESKIKKKAKAVIDRANLVFLNGVRR